MLPDERMREGALIVAGLVLTGKTKIRTFFAMLSQIMVGRDTHRERRLGKSSFNLMTRRMMERRHDR